MMGKDVFKIWAPIGAKWVDWVRPVSFVYLRDTASANGFYDFTIPLIHYVNEPLADTALIVDLPSHDSVKEGLALAKQGWRPIPLYNGTREQPGGIALVDNHSIENALLWGSLVLKKINIASDAPPAFLLDSNRMHRFKMNASVFDNSWDLYHQDFPSAEYFLDSGINKMIIRSEKVQKDLIRILYDFQKKGISFFLTNEYEISKPVTLKKPLGRKSN